MVDELRIVFVDDPQEHVMGIIGPAIGNYNEQHAGDHEFQRVCLVLETPEQETVGGLIGAIYWDWFHVDLLWVQDELRGRGYGRRLMTLAEQEARRRGARHAYLDTFSFQAPDFYRKLGYQVFGELEDYPRGHQRYFFTKQL